MMQLAGKSALVTGASGDTGMAIALALVEAGATVHATGRREDRLLELRERAPERIVPHVAEFSDADAAERLIAATGPIDILVCNAAHPPEMAPLLKGGMSSLRSIMEVNFFAAAALIHAVLPGMIERGWGRVIAISSIASSIGEAYGPSYCASKAALDGMLRNLAIDYSPEGITFNSIEPGPIATERLAGWGATKARRLAMAACVRRVAQPEDVAYAVQFLASPQASIITGESMRLDGGLSLGNPLSAMYVRQAKREDA